MKDPMMDMGRNQQQIKTAKLSIDGKDFILVDTPGFTKEKTSSTWGEINKRFTSDRRSHLDECMKKLNNDNVIIVFTKSSKVETETPEKMKNSFADFVTEYIEKVNHRWVVAPNPDIYDEHNYVTTNNMNHLKT
ncbi:15711_t:CDS:2, partial [Racocetra fulgida]